MKLDHILNEFDRLEFINENDEFKQFYMKKLDEFDIYDPSDNIEEFFESLNEEWLEPYDVDEMVETFNEVLEESDHNLNERFLYHFLNEKFKRVVRKGKVIRKRVCKPGYVVKGGKCVKQKASDKRKLSRSAKKAARKRKSKKSSTSRKQKKSMRKSRRLTN